MGLVRQNVHSLQRCHNDLFRPRGCVVHPALLFACRWMRVAQSLVARLSFKIRLRSQSQLHVQ